MNITAIPSRGFAPTADSLAKEIRALADAIESGGVLAIKAITVIETPAGGVTVFCYGNPTTNAHAAGLMVAAQLKLLLPEDE